MRGNQNYDGDDLAGQPPDGSFYKWALGVVLPLVIMRFGGYAVYLQETVFTAGRGTMTLQGTNALAFGVAAISLGLFLHCHYFWGNIYDQIWFAVLGKIISICGFIGGLGVLIVRVGVLGLK